MHVINDYEKNNELSRLYNLEPLNLETENTESLHSYICRLASAHGVLTGTLLNKELIPTFKKDYFIRHGDKGFYSNSHTLNGMHDNAMDFIAVLSKLTSRDDLKYLTMATWKNIVPAKGLLKKGYAYCPLCFEEWEIEGKNIYTPLLWNFQAVKACSNHEIYLKDNCPNCNIQLPFLHRKSILGYCSKCHKWLGMNRHHSGYKKISPNESEWIGWVNRNIGELIAVAPRLKANPEREQISQIMNHFINDATNNNISQFSKIFKIPKTTVHDWVKGKAIPTLEKLLIISFGLDISVFDMLTKTEFNLIKFNINRINTVTTYLDTSKDSKPNSYEKSLDKNHIKNSLEKFLDSKPPVPMIEVAKILGINQRTLYRWFPDICKLISKDYKTYRHLKSLHRKEFLYSKVKSTIDELINKELYPSRRRIEFLLSGKVIVKEDIVKRAWKDKLREYEI